MLRQSLLLACLCLATLLPGGAIAQMNAPFELIWLCWLETRDGFYVRCRLEEDPLAQAIAETDSPFTVAITLPMEQRAIRSAIFQPGRAPNVARLVREQPAQYAALTWSIPLHSLPFDDSPLRELTQSVMCGPDRGCMTFLGRPEALVQLARVGRR